MSSRSEFTYLSTFAGCGGSSLGYKWAGGHGVAAVEFDANAAETYRLNFPDTPVLQRDIATVTAEELLALTGLQVRELDILDGSPPCQGFSTAGKREFSDPRNSLFKEYVRLIEGLQPKVFVMENVSGMVKGKMKLAFRDIMLALKGTGYTVRCKLLNAMYYEVPQSRERLIWIGVRPDVGREPEFPEPVGAPPSLKSVVPSSSSIANSSFREAWRSSDEPSATICKSGPGKQSGIIRIAEGTPQFVQRAMTIDEVKLVASFPPEHRLTGSFAEQWARIGNSVPPRFMYHIATHIRDHVLPAPEGA
jgi:DNA (cytosine-5)-methyltransferase 1